jgi:hypothetical protein
MNLFWACLFCEGQKSRALAAQSFCFEKNKKDFKQTAPSLMQKCDNISYFGQMDTNLIINL